jgi:hypothetical protein
MISWRIVALVLVASPAAAQVPCVDIATRESMRALMSAALDKALQEHFDRLFEVWMKDPRDQPARIATGLRRGLSAYTGSRRAIANWSPPLCPQ